MQYRRRKQTNRLLVAAGFVAVSVTAAACSSTTTASSASHVSSPKALTNVTAVYFPGAIIGMEVPLANHLGYFKQNGLNVTMVTATSGAAEAATLASGSAQFGGLVFPLPPASVASQLKFLGGDTLSDYSIIVQPNTPLPDANKPFPQNLRDLKGLTVGISGKGSFLDYFVQALVKDAGLSPGSVTEIALGTPASQIAAFEHHTVQALAEGPPDEQVLPTGSFKYLYNGWPPVHAFNNYMLDANVASASYVTSHPKQVQGFCQALVDTYKYQEQPKNSGKIETFLQSYMNLTPQQAKGVWTKYSGAFNLSLTKARWDQESKTIQATFGAQYKLPSYKSAVYTPCAQIFNAVAPPGS